MSRCTVVWLQDAIQELGQIWLDAADRNAVTDAATEVDRGLQYDAMTKGKVLSEGLCAYDAPPLRAVFSVSKSDRMVEEARIRLL